MNEAVSTAWPGSGGYGGRWLFPLLLVVGLAATSAMAIVTNGNVGATVAPVLGVTTLVVVWFLPLRVSLFALMFLGLAVDASGDGPWDSPLAPIGRILSHNLNKTIPISALALPLMTFALLYLLLIRLYRGVIGSRVDRSAPLSKPMRGALWVSLLTIAFEVINGYRAGGDIQMAKVQVQDFVLILLTAYLFASALRGTRDYMTLGTILVLAACSKGAIALWSYYTVVPTPPVATTHGDSLLFASGCTILLARFVEKPVRRNGLLCLLILPWLLSAMVVNNRRLVWVELSASVITLYLASRRSPLKRLVTNAVLISVPLLALYVGAGWNSQASIFAPVRTFRSVGDADVDSSTLFRHLENYNLLHTMRFNPIIGTGFGHPFDEVVTTPDLPFFKEYQYLPHNSILGLWCFTGVVGITGLFMAIIVGVHLAARSYYRATVPEQRAAAFTAVAVLMIYLVHCYGDIGFSERNTIFLVGAALGVAGQLAATVGGWEPHVTPKPRRA